MKKSIHFVIIFVLVCCSAIAFAQNRSINFEKGTWREIEKKAGDENKIIFVDLHQSDCEQCKAWAKYVFANDSVADFYNQHFISCSREVQKTDLPWLGQHYYGSSEQTFLFLNQYGQLLHQGTYGSRMYLIKDGKRNEQEIYTRDIAELMELGKTALDPEKRFGTWHYKYVNGNREPEFIRQYLKMLVPYGGDESREIAYWYLATQKDEDLLTKENFEIIDKFGDNAKTHAFQYVVANRAKFRELAGTDKVDNLIYRTYYRMICGSYDWVRQPGGYEKQVVNEKKFNDAKEIVKQSGFEKTEELFMESEVWYYDTKKDFKNYAKVAVPYVNKYRMNDYKHLNYTAWYFYAHDEITDPAMLNQALGWAKKCVDDQPTPAAYDTYASLLLKLKKKNEALKAIQASIDMRKKAGEEITNSKYLLDKITAMK